MSRDYTIEIILDEPTTEETIRKILLRGEKYHIEYIDQSTSESLTTTKKRLSLEKAVQEISLGLKDPEDIENLPVIAMKIDDSYCLLVFGKPDVYTTISLGIYGNIWMKNSGQKNIDFDRYIRLLLDLCQDFPIVELKTLDSYRDGYA